MKKTAPKKPIKKPAQEDTVLSDRWITRRVKLAELKPFEHNPRKATKEQFDRLITSIQRFGYHALIMATHDLRVIDGHHRLKALRQLGFKDIEVRVAAEPMPDEMFKEMVIRANVNYATWDTDLLAAQYDAESLIDYGLSESFLLGGGEEPLPDLANGEKEPFQQMTFMLHDSQAEIVKAAIAEAQRQYPKDPNNENKNGNALFFIAQQFVGQ